MAHDTTGPPQEAPMPARIPSRTPEGFTPLDAQLENIRRANASRGWGFTDEQFAKITYLAARWPSWRGGSNPVVLVPYLSTAATTLRELWDVIVGTYPRTSLDPRVIFDEAHVRYHLNNRRAMSCGLRIEELSWWWKYTLLPGYGAAHAGVLAAFAHHPAWVERTMPRTLLLGFSIHPAGATDDRREFAPTLEFARDGDGAYVHLGVHTVAEIDHSITKPEIYHATS